jgi:diguanylate cyclase (GGDEF)-like protein
MDVQSLQLTSGFPIPGRPRLPRRRVADAPPTPPSPGGPAAGAVTSTRELLLAYTGVSIVLGLGALAWTTLTVPLLPAIDPGLDGSSLAGPEGGLLLWIAFGLIGSLRVLPIPGSSAVWTFHFPFIAAAMVLGGPTAGAWVAFLATLERRELESQPWYGTLANHSVMALGAVVGGLSVLVVRGALASSSVDPGTAGVIAIAVGTLVLAVTANGMAAGTIILRERLAPMAMFDILIRSFGRVTLAEIGLASMFTVAYVAVGWWAPAALAIVVLLVWPGEGFEGIDPLMKLPRNRQFQHDFDTAVARTRRGTATGGVLMMLDLDHFGEINKNDGKHVGDEVLAEVGDRLRAIVRTTDLVGRLGGDELAMFYRGEVDEAAARRLASRVEQAICAPIMTTAGVRRVGVSIGGLIVRPAPDIPSSATLMTWADRDMQAQKKAMKQGRATSGIRFHPYGRHSTRPDEAKDAERRRWWRLRR